MITIYTKAGCSNCTILAGACKRKGIEFEKVDITADGVLGELQARFPDAVIRSLPVVLVNNTLLTENPTIDTIIEMASH